MLTTQERICLECNMPFLARSSPSKVKSGIAKFCSKKCLIAFNEPRRRFFRTVKKTANCWEWVGRKTVFGYGHFFMNGRLEQAHRASYKLHKGKILKNICVCHSCDNRICVNPDHLWLGTRNDNIQDMIKKGRAHKADPEDNGGAKLTWDKVEKIRLLYKTGEYFQRELAVMFGVDTSQVKRIVNNWSWKI